MSAMHRMRPWMVSRTFVWVFTWCWCRLADMLDGENHVRRSPVLPLSMPALALSDSLLASSVTLPPNPAVFYRRLSPISPRNPHEQIELVRQHLLSLNASESLLHSLLASVHIAAPHPSIYVFAISSYDQPTDAVGKIQDLRFDYMTGTSLG